VAADRFGAAKAADGFVSEVIPRTTMSSTRAMMSATRIDVR
jgi:hypothetical protein